MSRTQTLQNALHENNLDALLISNYYNILYLSGFKGLSPEERESWILVTDKNAYFFTDDRYESRPKNFVSKTVSIEKRITDHLLEIIKEEKLTQIGCESESLTVAELIHFEKKLSSKLLPTKNLIRQMRAVKSTQEIATIQTACTLIDECLADITKTIRVGRTESEIALNIESWIKKKGHELAFYPIVAVDENSSIPHYDTRTNGKKKIKKDSLILIDCGVRYKDYCSDITRVFFAGSPSDEQKNIYDLVVRAQQEGVKTVAVDKDLKSIDETCRTIIRQAGTPNYSHSTGHGIGLEVHELPKVSPVSKEKLVENNVITIEPGVYMPGKFGVRIEDTVLVEKTRGLAMTKTPLYK